MPLSLEPQDATAEGSAKADVGDLALPRRLDSKYASELVRELSQARGADLSINAKDVELVGMQCAIALASAVKTWNTDEKALKILGLSASGLSDLRNLGLPLEDALSP